MKTNGFLGWVLVVTLLAASSRLVGGAARATNDATPAARAPGPIIVDHRAVQEFDQIPDYWLNEAKKLVIHYGHTSHGSQILSGLVFLQRVNPTKYTMNIRSEGNAQVSATVPLTPSARVPVGVASGGESTLRISQEGAWPIGYWWSSTGLSGTQQVLSYQGGLFDVSGWSWCGQVAYCDSNLNCANDQYIYDYLNTLTSLETSFPAINFFYMTGHVVGPNPNANLDRRNGIIRTYATNNGKVLYDFADIESWDLDGNYHANATADCEWCKTWCDDPAHADDMECQYQALLPLDSDDYYGGAGCGSMASCEKMCAHSHGINCVVKGKAFWWMMARIAGWEGTTSADTLTLHGTPASQTIHLDWVVTGALPVTSTWRISYYSQTLPITINNILSPTRAYTLTGLTNYIWYTVTLNAMLNSTPLLTDTVRVMPTDRLVYLPLILRQ